MKRLLDDLGNHAGADGTTAFTDGETQTFFHSDRGDQLDSDRHVVTRHHHFLVGWQLDGTGHVGGTEVELRTVVVEERSVATAFVLAQNVHFASEVGVRLDGAGLAQHLAALHFFTLGAAQQDAHVVASLTLVQQLAEHFHAGAGGLLGVSDTDDLDFFANLDDAALDTAGHHGAATRDGEHVFHGHQEGTVHSALRRGDVGVQRVGQLHDGFFAQGTLVAFQRQLGRTLHDGGVVAREVVLGEQLAHFHFDQFQQLGVVHHVALVQEDDDVGHAHLARQQDVLTGLGHRAVSGRAHQDGAVHLRGTRDHVLHVVGVTRAVHVRVVTVGRLVFHVRGVDRDAARLLFGRRVDLVVRLGFATELARQHRRDRRRQRRLAVVHVTDRAHVHVRLGTFELAFCHVNLSRERTVSRVGLRSPDRACHGQPT